MLDECPTTTTIWERGSGLFKSNGRHIDRPDITISEWPKNIFKNKIVNIIWDLYPGFVVLEIWKTNNLKIFENKKCPVDEIWETLTAHLKETLTLTTLSREYLEAKEIENKILQDWGMGHLPQNNSYLSKTVQQTSSIES